MHSDMREQAILSKLSRIYMLEHQLSDMVPTLQYAGEDVSYAASCARRLSELQAELDFFEAMLDGPNAARNSAPLTANVA